MVQQSHPVPSKNMPLTQSHDMTGSNTHSHANQALAQSTPKPPISQAQAQPKSSAAPQQPGQSQTQQKNSYYTANPK